jgi:hypothetical protein
MTTFSLPDVCWDIQTNCLEMGHASIRSAWVTIAELSSIIKYIPVV